MSPVIYVNDPSGSIIATVRQYEAYLSALVDEIAKHPQEVLEELPEVVTAQKRTLPMTTGRRVFVVHGRDEARKHEVAHFLSKLQLEPVILHEQPSRGRTIIEKFEDYSDVAYAVILLTPDDVGKLASEKTEPRPRARQNVGFELGFFVGRLGRNRVCALHQGNTELPSDYGGVVYIPLDEGGAWKMSLGKELKEAGVKVDLNKAI